MQAGDLVKITAPEHTVGWPAGKIGLITTVLEKNNLADYVVSVACDRGLETVYVLHNEVVVISASR